MTITHATIIDSAGGATAFARAIGIEDANPVHQWRRNDSIPAPYWQSIAAVGLATLEQLAQAAAPKARHRAGSAKTTPDPTQDAAA